jgi:hypothetical protein
LSAIKQRGQDRLHLQPCKMNADASVNTMPPAEMITGIPADIKTIRIGIFSVIAIGATI